jgi:hypothetical protein
MKYIARCSFVWRYSACFFGRILYDHPGDLKIC